MPDRGKATDVFTVYGRGFPPGLQIKILIDGRLLSTHPGLSAADGSFTTVVDPTELVGGTFTPGPHEVQAFSALGTIQAPAQVYTAEG
jgi:hypothetical protein